MKFSLLAAASIVPFATAQPPYEGMWEDFKQTFGKTYNGDEESRFQVFKTNVDHIVAVNDEGLSYTLGVNQFTDLTPEEFEQQYLGYEEMRTQWTSSQLPFLGTHYYHGERLEDSLDWVEKGAVGPVKNQGSCGSCWAFSARGALESAWTILTGDSVTMSEQQLVDCAKSAGNGCSGGNMVNSFAFDQDNSVCTEETYPYEAKDGSCRAGGCTPGIPVGGVTGYKQVAKNSEEGLQSAIMLGPVAIAVAAAGSFQSYKSGILTSCGTALDHGIVAVGYGTDGGKKYWKVRNSWGGSWGEDGYGRLARGTGGAGMCGILTDASYPTVKPCDPKCCGSCDCTKEEVCSEEAPCCGTECCDTTSGNTCCDGGGCAHQEKEEMCCGAEGGGKKCDKAENCCGGTCCNNGAACQAGKCCAAANVCGDQCCGTGPMDKKCQSKTDPTKCTCITSITDTCCDSGTTCSIGQACCGETCCGWGEKCKNGQCSHTTLVL